LIAPIAHGASTIDGSRPLAAGIEDAMQMSSGK
jgi:hypothetical protein